MIDNQFDHDEFKESYAHYRHLEQERSRHLTFFFTLVGGLFGVLGFVLKDGKSIIGTDWFLFLTCISVVFLQVFEIFTYVSVRRVGDARVKRGRWFKVNLLFRSLYGSVIGGKRFVVESSGECGGAL